MCSSDLEEARERAYAEAEEELADLRREAARLAQGLERARHDSRAVREIQSDLARVSRQLEHAGGREVPAERVQAETPAVGRHVRVPGFTEPGEVLTLPDSKGELEVQVGAFRVRVQAAELQPAPKPRSYPPGVAFKAAQKSAPPASLSQPLDMRGVRAEEVEPLLDRELNEAFSAGVLYLKIIHGHGSGIVRRIVRDYLAEQPYVASYEPASPGNGGDGATIVTLAV